MNHHNNMTLSGKVHGIRDSSQRPIGGGHYMKNIMKFIDGKPSHSTPTVNQYAGNIVLPAACASLTPEDLRRITKHSSEYANIHE